MIPWWAWILIWVGLALALLVVLATLLYTLFRKSTAVLDELSAVVDKMAVLDVAPVESSRPQIAVLAEMREVRAEHDDRKRLRADVKRTRHNDRIARARRIMKHDASTSQWPEGWS